MSKVAFLFPGQGAQTVGMGAELCARSEPAREIYARAGDILGYDLSQLCFEGPAERLDSTVVSQPALFVTSLAALADLRAREPGLVESCQGAAGLSLGEYTAMVFADAMDFETALRVVQRRGEAMQEASDASPSGMVSVLGLDREKIEQLCREVRQEGEVLQVANLLCPGNIAVSGSQAACERMADAAASAGAMKVIPLAVAGAFHTPLMDSAVPLLEQALVGVEIRPPRLPVYSNVDASPHEDPETLRQILVRQVVSPVRWEDSLRQMLADGFDQFYEVGPGRVLRGLLKRVDRKVPSFGVMDEA